MDRKDNNNTYLAPKLEPRQVDLVVVRDELLKCFESANREFFEILHHLANDDDQIKQQTRQFLITVFQSCGVSFDNPSKEGIITAIEQCKKNAEGMMGEKGTQIIDHHYIEIMKLVNKL